jgi:hypothetical protein
MNLVHVVGNVRWRLLSLLHSAPPGAGELRAIDERYRITRFRTLTRRAVSVLPPVWREWTAECFLRRAGAPGPAAEHIAKRSIARSLMHMRVSVVPKALFSKLWTARFVAKSWLCWRCTRMIPPLPHEV